MVHKLASARYQKRHRKTICVLKLTRDTSSERKGNNSQVQTLISAFEMNDVLDSVVLMAQTLNPRPQFLLKKPTGTFIESYLCRRGPFFQSNCISSALAASTRRLLIRRDVTSRSMARSTAYLDTQRFRGHIMIYGARRISRLGIHRFERFKSWFCNNFRIKVYCILK
jgi:hypothetical protein